jgi:hypothetical protein
MYVGDTVRYTESYIEDSVTYAMEPYMTCLRLQAWRAVVREVRKNEVIVDEGNGCHYPIKKTDLVLVPKQTHCMPGRHLGMGGGYHEICEVCGKNVYS